MLRHGAVAGLPAQLRGTTVRTNSVAGTQKRSARDCTREKSVGPHLPFGCYPSRLGLTGRRNHFCIAASAGNDPDTRGNREDILSSLDNVDSLAENSGIPTSGASQRPGNVRPHKAPAKSEPPKRIMSSSMEGASLVELKEELREAEASASTDDFMDTILRGVAATLHSAAAALSALSSTNARWLRQRRRKRWWRRNLYPKVPGVGKNSEVVDVLSGPLLLKMLPLAALFFCASFNYTILSATKDAIIITAPGGGVEVVPFLMTYGVLPCSVAFMVAYSALVERLPPHLVFYATCLPLLAFYALFAFVLFPAAGHLHPHAAADALEALLPVGARGFVAMGRNWTYSLFFCASELWGGVVISLLFWSLANEVCNVKEAKTLYPLLGLSANVALICAGKYLRVVNDALAAQGGAAALQALVATVLVGGAGMFLTKSHIDNRLLPPKQATVARRKKKERVPLSQTLQLLMRTPKIRALAALVVSYGLCHRLFEVCWKGQLRSVYTSPQAYGAVLGDVGSWTGALTIFMMLFGRYIFAHLGWRVAALATPVAMLASGVGFFGLAVAGSPAFLNEPAMLTAAVLAGAATQIFARSFKYSLFDPSKEMVYIEMSKEEKTKGKATVDLIGSQIGKSGASWTLQALMLVCGSLSGSVLVIGVAYCAMCVFWLSSVWSLSDMLSAESKSKQGEAAAQGGAGVNDARQASQ